MGRLKKPPAPSTLGLWHRLLPMTGTRSTRWRLCFYSCNTLAAGLPGGETCSDCLYLVILGWIPRGQATASATALLGPWLDSFIRLLKVICPRLAFRADSAAPAMAPVIIVIKIRRGGCFCHQVPATGIAKRHNQICFLHQALGGGRSHSFSPDYDFVPVAATRVERILARWLRRQGIAATINKRGLPCCQSHHTAVVLLFLYILCYSL